MAEKKASSKKAKRRKPGKPAKRKPKRKPKSRREKTGGQKSDREKAPQKAAAEKSESQSQSQNESSKATTGLDKSVAQFRESLEQSVTLSRDRIQEVVDDAVKRGRMTRGDAENMLSDLVKKGRKQTDSLLKSSSGWSNRRARGRRPAAPVRKQATQAARRARKKLG